MTQCLDAKIQIQRKVKKKILGEFREVFDAHLALDGQFVRNGSPHKGVFVFPGIVDAAVGDRILFEDSVFDVANVQKHDLDTLKETVAACEENGFESGWKQLQVLGCDVKYGFFETFQRDIEAEAQFDSWVGTYITNIVAHYDEIKNGRHIGELYALFNHDVPVACVGAGPSLDSNVEELRNFPGVIIAADRAYKMLLARDIEPDLVISVDCHYDLVADMLAYPGSNRHKLVLNTCADPKINRVWKGKIFWFLMKHPGVQFTDIILPALFPQFRAIENVGCVGNSAVLLAEQMGLGPVVLVGQDYGYTNGRMFAQRFSFDDNGTPSPIADDHAALMEKRSGKILVDGVATYVPFRSYRDTLYDIQSNRKISIVNCTEGGILNGLPKKPLAQMIEELSVSSNGAYLRARGIIRSL